MLFLVDAHVVKDYFSATISFLPKLDLNKGEQNAASLVWEEIYLQRVATVKLNLKF